MAIPTAAARLLLVCIAALNPLAPRDEGDDQYQFIVGLLEKGMTELAVKEATSFLRERAGHPKTDLARYRLACALFELGEHPRAAEHLRELSTRPGFDYAAEVHFRLGQCELAQERIPAAETALERVLALDADYLRVPATYLLGDAALRDGRHEQAAARFEQVIGSAPAGEYAGDARAGHAWCAFHLGRWGDAARRAQEYLRRDKGGERVEEMRLLLGEARLEEGRPRDALKAYDAVRSAEWGDAALRGAGFAHAELGEHAQAAAVFHALRERFPDSRFLREATLQEGVELLLAGDAAGALRVLDEETVGDDAEVFYWRAQARERAGDAQGALGAIESGLNAQPDQELRERLQAARGDVLTVLGRGAEAVEAYAHSGSDYALHAAVVASLNAGRSDEAVALATRFLDEHPDSAFAAETRLALGEALLQEARYASAADVFRAAAQGVDDSGRRGRALARLAWCCYLEGELVEAASTFERVARDHPEEAEEALFMQGRAELDAGDAEAAARTWRAFGKRFRGSARGAEVQLELARLAGDEAAAIVTLRKLLGEYPDSELAAEARYELAEHLARTGDRDAARDEYASLLERHPGSELVPAAAYGLAFAHFEADDFTAAVEVLGSVPRDAGTAELRLAKLELVVWCERGEGDTRGAVAAYSELAAATTDEQRLWEAARVVLELVRGEGRPELGEGILDELEPRVTRGEIRAAIEAERAFLALDRGDVETAERIVRGALRGGEAPPSLAEACFFVGEARFEAGDDAAASELFRAAFEIEDCPRRDRALYKGGFAALRGDDLDGAQARFERLVREFPDSVLYGESLFLWGECAFRRGRHEEAALALARLLRELPRHEAAAQARFRLGISLARLERWDRAEQVLSDLASRHADFEHVVEAELWRARALAALGRQRNAEQAFRRVVAGDRGALAAQARIGLGGLLREANDTEGALAEFLKVSVLYDLPEEVGEALLLAGECLAELGDDARARAQYEELQSRYPRSEHAAEARRRLGARATF